MKRIIDSSLPYLCIYEKTGFRGSGMFHPGSQVSPSCLAQTAEITKNKSFIVCLFWVYFRLTLNLAH